VTDQRDTAVINVGLDLLIADNGLAVKDGDVPDGTVRPYVLVYSYVSRPDDADSDALDGPSRTMWVRWYCHCVGDNRLAASEVSQRVRTQLLNIQPASVPGHAGAVMTMIQQEQANAPIPDKTTGVLVQDAVCVYKSRVTF
jgi:hypothetical protein